MSAGQRFRSLLTLLHSDDSLMSLASKYMCQIHPRARERFVEVMLNRSGMRHSTFMDAFHWDVASRNSASENGH